MITGSKCVIRLGLPGCGKSLDQTEQEVLEHLIAGTEVYCCYWINWNLPNYHYFPPTRKGFDSIKDQRNCVVVFDELAQIFDPRDWTEEGGEVRRWFQLHRHFHIDIYANTQDVSLVAKSVGIIADEWQYIEKIEQGAIARWIFSLFGLEYIKMHKSYLSWQQLKKIANGWELGEDVAIDGNWEIVNYRLDKIVHSELDELKEELVHKYCEKCAARQGEQIKKEQTNNEAIYSLELKEWKLRKVEYCPKHKEEELKVRLSGLYDTDYTPETDEEQIEFVAMIDSPKGWRKIPYKGLLSEKQNATKRGMTKNINRSYERNDENGLY